MKKGIIFTIIGVFALTILAAGSYAAPRTKTLPPPPTPSPKLPVSNP